MSENDSGPMEFNIPTSTLNQTVVHKDAEVAERNKINIGMFKAFRSQQYIESNIAGKMGLSLSTFKAHQGSPSKHTNLSLPMLLHFDRNVFRQKGGIQSLTQLKKKLYSEEFSLLVFTRESIPKQHITIYDNDSLKGLFRQLLNLACDDNASFQAIFDQYTICEFLLVLLGKALISQQPTDYEKGLNSHTTLISLAKILDYELSHHKDEWSFSDIFSVYTVGSSCWFERPSFASKEGYDDAIYQEEKKQFEIEAKLAGILKQFSVLRQNKANKIYQTVKEVSQSQFRKLQIRSQQLQLEYQFDMSVLQVAQYKSQIKKEKFSLLSTSYYRNKCEQST